MFVKLRKLVLYTNTYVTIYIYIYKTSLLILIFRYRMYYTHACRVNTLLPHTSYYREIRYRQTRYRL